MSAEHEHTHAPLSFNSAFAVGIMLNMVFVAIESFYGWQVNSLALLADAGHNLSDVAGLVLAWGGTLAVKLRPNARHTYGWKRATILAAFANALLLLLAMGALAWEAIGRLASSQPTVQAQGITIMVVACVGIVINTATALLFMRGRDSDLNIRGAFMHMVADALVSAGVVVVGALSLWMAWTWLDPVVSLIIAGIILLGTWGLFKQSLHMLFDGVPDSVDPSAVYEFLAHLPGVSQVNDLHIWAMGTSHIAMTAHLVMPHGNTDDAFLQSATEQMHDRFDITHVTLQVMQRAFSAGCVEQTDFDGCSTSPAKELTPGHAH
jgi:cobalt-zinc-cadmium efflux system protein